MFYGKQSLIDIFDNVHREANWRLEAVNNIIDDFSLSANSFSLSFSPINKVFETIPFKMKENDLSRILKILINK